MSIIQDHIHVPAPTEEDLDGFKENVLAWISLDDQMKKLKLAAKERKKAMNVLSKSIKEFMMRHEIDDIKTSQGKIQFIRKEVKKPVSLNELKETLESVSETKVYGKELLDRVFSAVRPVVLKEVLKRSTPRNTINLNL